MRRTDARQCLTSCLLMNTLPKRHESVMDSIKCSVVTKNLLKLRKRCAFY